MRMNRLVPVIASAIACGACSASADAPNPDSFPVSSFLAATTDSSLLRVELRTSPQPPPRGTIDAQLVITNVADGTPRDGLHLAIRPWMPAYNHGAIPPTVTAQGEGKYLVTNLDLFMPGRWELRTTISGPVSDHVTPAFDIQ